MPPNHEGDPAPTPNPRPSESPATSATQPSRPIAILNAIAPIIASLAWPATVLFLAWFAFRHAGNIAQAFDRFLTGKESVEASVSTTGIAFKVLQGLKEQGNPSGVGAEEAAKVFARWGVDVSAAICKLGPEALARKQPLAKVLWVDPHPGNNIGLEYAFGALGILVVDINSNGQIEKAFRTAGGFDLVITNMDRDDDPAGNGLRTVDIIRDNYPPTPVIIFSAGYARSYEAEHKGQKNYPPPILTITYYTDEVFNKVIDAVASLNHPPVCSQSQTAPTPTKP
jgi:hypothetical protein